MPESLPVLDQGLQPIELFPAPAVELPRAGRFEQRGDEESEIGSVALEHGAEARIAAEPFVDFGLAMECGDPVGKIAHQTRVESAAGRQTVEEGRLIEPAHDHDRVHGCALAAELEPAIRATADFPRFQIELRRGAAVEGELGG